jgi:hypothetical protein
VPTPAKGSRINFASGKNLVNKLLTKFGEKQNGASDLIYNRNQESGLKSSSGLSFMINLCPQGFGGFKGRE